VAERWQQLGWVTAAGLAAWLLYELTRVPEVPAPPPPVAASDPGAEPAAEAPRQDLAMLRVTLERPLFDDDRRPNPPADGTAAAPEPAAPSRLPPVRLTAVIVTPGGGRMVLLQPEGEETQRARQGDQIAGWRVEEISDEAVVLSAGGERSTLPLRVFETHAAKTPARPVARRRPVDPARKPPTKPTPTPAPAEAAAARTDAEPRGQPAGTGTATPEAQPSGGAPAQPPSRKRVLAPAPPQQKRN
jgi:hypothetical protein